MPVIERCVVCQEDDAILRQCARCWDFTHDGECAEQHSIDGCEPVQFDSRLHGVR